MMKRMKRARKTLERHNIMGEGSWGEREVEIARREIEMKSQIFEV